ncbi:MAG: GTPase domain-containing protein [Trebonia sp.]
MTVLDQIVYRAPSGPRGMIMHANASPLAASARALWLSRLEPWLKAGGPPGRGYLRFESQAALLRWHPASGSRHAWEYAHALVGEPGTLTAGFALRVRELPARLPGLPPGNGLLPVVETPGVKLADPDAIRTRARSKETADLLVPLLGRALAGERAITLPWADQSLPEAVAWAAIGIFSMLGDTRPVSFLTHATGQAVDIPGLFISFRPGAAVLPPDPGFEQVAAGLASDYADSPKALREKLSQHGVPRESAQSSRLARLLELWPRPTNAHPRSTQTVNSHPGAGTAGRRGKQVTCPICLTSIPDWEAEPRWRWNPDLGDQGEYEEFHVPPQASGPQRANLERGLVIRCPNTFRIKPEEHYLPLGYGSFGRPVVLGFVGMTRSGKTHLLAAMVGAMQTGLRAYGIDCRAMDRALHNEFLDNRVRPLLTRDAVLPGTPEGVVTFADAFLMKHGKGLDRPVVLFDVAGGDLTSVYETKKFLDMADGLFFVVDPSQTGAGGTGDDTFSNVIDLLKDAGRVPEQVSAAIVLNKADLVRFEDPVTRWLRSDGETLSAAEFCSESRDVYAYLYEKGAAGWALPYEECAKATLHVVSPTGGAGDGDTGAGVFPRGVTPRRVLRPMIAMLAMTGVLTGAEAEKVGI